MTTSEQDIKNLVRRQMPVFAAGLYVKSKDIIESAKDILVSTRPELLQLDLSKEVDIGYWDELATECIDEIIKNLKLEDEIAAIDTSNLEMSFNPDYIFIGTGMIHIRPDETQSQFFSRILEAIKSTGIKLEVRPLDKDEEPPELEHGLAVGKVEMGIIADIRTYYTEPEFAGEIDEIDESYNQGFIDGVKQGVSETYDAVMVSLYKINSRKKFTKNFYVFLDELKGTFVGLNDAESDIWKKKLNKYIEKSKNDEMNKEEKENV